MIPEVDLDPYFKDEIIVGFEWQATRNWVLDAKALYYPWTSPLDELTAAIQELIRREEARKTPRAEIFRMIWDLAGAGEFPHAAAANGAPMPYLTEPWYCCAEPAPQV